MDDEVLERPATAASGPGEPIGDLAPIDEDWVYDLDGKPWGVAEVESKKLSLRRDGGGGNTRRWIRPKVVPGGDTGKTTVEIDLHHQRRTSKTAPYAPLNLGTFKGGEWTRLPLNSDETLMLYKHLQNLYVIGDEGVVRGQRRLRVVDADEVTVSGELADIIEKLRAENDDAALAETLEALLPDLVDAVALKRERAKRIHAIQEFDAHLPDGQGAVWSEPQWKQFFRENDWIFGHNLDYQFLVEEEPEAYVGGKRLSGKGSQFADHVRSTPGDWSFAVLVEIKRPDTNLVAERPYREGTWRIHQDLADGVAQAQANVMSLVRRSNTLEGAEEMAERGLSVADPEGVLVIGSTSRLTNRTMRETFHRFRRNLWNPRVLTYDELLARAKFQVEQMAERVAGSTGDVPVARPSHRTPRGRPTFAAPEFTPFTDRYGEPEDVEPSEGEDRPAR